MKMNKVGKILLKNYLINVKVLCLCFIFFLYKFKVNV